MFLPLGQLIVARLAQLDKRRPTEREAVDSKPGRTSTKGLQKTERKVQHLEIHLQTVRVSCLFG